MDRLFLDANVLFSAAYGSPGIERLWNLWRDGHCRLLVSRYVIEEARRNLEKSEQVEQLEERLKGVILVPESPADLQRPIDLAEKDRPVFSAVLAAKATHLITGDVRHFGEYYGQTIEGIKIVKPANYLETIESKRK